VREKKGEEGRALREQQREEIKGRIGRGGRRAR